MPRIDWNSLPQRVKEHLIERLKQRRITIQDLEALREWIDSQPELPEGDWYKDFGSFKLSGHGRYPSTFLEPGMAAKGQKLL